MRAGIFGVLLFVFPIIVCGQDANFDADFNSQDLLGWSGTTENFIFITEDENILLRQNAPAEGVSWLSHPASKIIGHWELYISLDFSPSDNNKSEIYLMSTQENVTDSLNGYLLLAGESSSEDVFRVFRITNGSRDGEILTGTTNISASGEWRVKVTRDALGNWMLEVGKGYDGMLLVEDTGTDATYTTSQYFGFVNSYTSSNVNNFTFDFKIDLPPIEVTEVIQISNNELELLFSKEIDIASAQQTDFVLDPGNLSPHQISLIDSVTVGLTFSEAFDGGPAQLSVRNIKDISNETELADTILAFTLFNDFHSGDIIINEFLKDPPPGAAEYIELSNNSSRYINLKDWEVGDSKNLTLISALNLVLEPHKFAVISSDTAAVKSVFGDANYIQASLPALNNTGFEQIRVYDQNGFTVDSLQYDSDWGGTDVAFERRSATVSAIYRENWGESPAAAGGTPGAANAIETDTQAPQLTEVVFMSADSIKLLFSENLDFESASLSNNYTVNPDITIKNVVYGGNEIMLILANPLQNDELYTITASNQRDIFGNKASDITIQKRFLIYSGAGKQDVIVNEILYSRRDAASPEFIELYNISDHHFDLSNWILADASSSAVIPTGTTLRSGDYLVITDHQSFSSKLLNSVFLIDFPSLNDAGDAVVLKNSNGDIIDSLFYLRSWDGDQNGISIERKDPSAASNDAANWAHNNSENGFSAGTQNSVFALDETPPEILFAELQPDQKIFIAFTEFVDLLGADILINGTAASIVNYSPDNANTVLIEGSMPVAGEKLTLSFLNVRDFVGNNSTETSIEVAQKLQKGSVVINEILYDPLANTDDNLPDQAEYIELYNREEYAVSLEGIYIHDEADEEGEVRSILPDNSTFKWIPSKGYVLIYADDEYADFEQSKVNKYFELDHQDVRFTIRMDRSSLSLAASGDAVYLADSTGQVIDSVYYDESWQNPNLQSTKGVSLEKIDPGAAGNEASNWSSSTHISGGTPGYQNSINQVSGAIPVSTGISFTPNPFSPDDDGFEDHLFINYKLDQPDYLLRVRIFDRYGRLVRELEDGTSAGFEGSLIWDGLTDARKKNRIGIYIVLFEAYNSMMGRRKVFKKTVVLARRF